MPDLRSPVYLFICTFDVLICINGAELLQDPRVSSCTCQWQQTQTPGSSRAARHTLIIEHVCLSITSHPASSQRAMLILTHHLRLRPAATEHKWENASLHRRCCKSNYTTIWLHNMTWAFIPLKVNLSDNYFWLEDLIQILKEKWRAD